MNDEQKKKEIKKALQYLLNEGFVEQIGDKFRLKTNKELANEIRKMAKK
jgi:hypothetical protein